MSHPITRMARALALTTAVAAFTAVVLTGCAPAAPASDASTEPAKEVTILVPAYQPISDPVRQTLDESFTARTGITVSVETSGSEAWESVDQRVQQDLTAGRAPDVLVAAVNMADFYTEKGLAQALTEPLQDAGLSLDTLNASLLATGEVDGVQRAVPWGVSTLTLFYNADVFTKAGLDPSTPPTTLDELRATARQIVDSKAAKHGVVAPIIGSSGNFMFQNLAFQQGGTMTDDDGSALTFNDPGSVSALSYWSSLAEEGLYAPLNGADSSTAFTNQDAGMILSFSSVKANLHKSLGESLRAAEAPTADGTLSNGAPGGGSLIITARDADRRAASALVVAELLSTEAQSAMAASTGYLPIDIAAERALADDPLAGASIAQLDKLVPWVQFRGDNANQIQTELNAQLALALNGSKTAQAALDDAVAAGTKILGQ